MIEWILVVWLFSAAGLAPGFEIGTYRQLEGEHGCEAARDSVSINTRERDVGFIAMCVERDK